MEKDNSSRRWTVHGNHLSWRVLDADGWEAKTPTNQTNKTKITHKKEKIEKFHVLNCFKLESWRHLVQLDRPKRKPKNKYIASF